MGLLLIAPRAKATLPFLSTSSNAAFKINKPSLPSLFLPAPGRGKHLPSDSPRIFLPPCRARAQRRQNLRPSLLIIGARAFGLNATNAEITLHCYRYVYKHPQYCLIVRPSNDVSSALGSLRFEVVLSSSHKTCLSSPQSPTSKQLKIWLKSWLHTALTAHFLRKSSSNITFYEGQYTRQVVVIINKMAALTSV